MRVSDPENFRISGGSVFCFSESKNRAVGRGDAPATLSVPSRAFSIQQTRAGDRRIWEQQDESLEAFEKRVEEEAKALRQTSGV